MNSKVLSVLLVILVAASTVTGVLTLIQQNGMKKEIETITEAYNSSQDTAQEDDILICGEYKVSSTKEISDAYISGDTSALSDRDKETLDMAKKVIDAYIKSDMSDFDKEYEIYKYLTKEMHFDSGLLTVIPTTADDCDNPYGVLKYKSAVCVGYATTFRLFMQMMGIECKVVHSTDMTHTWDLVKLDGEWYHTDCYFDAETSNCMNFNMNDSLCAANHSWNTEFFPEATGTKYNFTFINCEEIENIYAIPEFVSKKIEQGSTSLSCKFKEEIAKDDEDTAGYIVNCIINALNNSDEEKYYESNWSKNDDGEYVLSIYCTYTSEETDFDLSDDVKEKADEAISEYFTLFDEEYFGDDFDYYGEANG